jgi:hypothetical protein
MLPLAAVHHFADLTSVLFILVALGCVIAAGFAAWANRWAAAAVLLVVAIVAAYLAS